MTARRRSLSHRLDLRLFLACTCAVLAGSVVACGWGDSSGPPTITAQGFDLTQPRKIQLGDTVSLRLRFEVPAGLESLRVRERSYDVDLARSPEPSHFPLFGLPQRVWSKTDVTLDFGPYVASKMIAAGDYIVTIEATDRSQQTATATLRIELRSPDSAAEADAIEAPEDAPDPTSGFPVDPGIPEESGIRVDPGSAATTPLRSGDFRLERVGRGPVTSGPEFGIAWKTVERNHVVIRLVGTDEDASRFVRLAPGAFADIDTREQFVDAIDGARLEPSLEFAAANNAAAGTEVAIVRATGSTLLRADHSKTRLSDLGTTVTLTGRYKR